MGVRYLSQGFAGTPVLPLPGSLLNQFIGDHEPCVAPVRVKTSAIGIRPLPFKHGRKTTTVAAMRVFFTRHFDHAAELQAKFGGVSCRPDIQRLEFFDVYRLREGRRAVVIKWDPVDHVLNVVFRATWM